MDSNHSSCWESILEKVRPLIPTIDSDSSASDNEEIVTLYQRPAGLSLKVPPELNGFSLDDDFKLLEPAVLTSWSKETLSQPVEFDYDEIVEDASARERAKQHADVIADAWDGATAEWKGERCDASLEESVDSIKSNKGFPVLSFARLDRFDLDHVLQNLKEGGLSLQQYVSAEPVKTHGNRNKDECQEKIMGKLAAFLGTPSSQSASQPEKSQKPMSQKEARGKSTERQQSQQERPTVFVDLRRPDPLIKQPKPSDNLSSGFESPAKHNNHQEPPAKNLEVHTGSQAGGRDMTGKSMLLRTRREKQNDGSVHQQVCPDSSHSVQSEAAEQPHDDLKPVEFNVSREPQSPREDKQRGGRQTNHGSKMNKRKHRSDQQGRQIGKTLEHEHHFILKQLEKHRPTASVNQRQPAAENTDTLYHSEASHLQPVSTLPADIKSKVCMILIVNLSSPGVVADGGHLFPAATKSHIYNILVAWFLSLVGPSPRPDEGDAGAKVPFWVAGLQQQWTEDGLALHVLAVARRCYTPNNKQRDVHPLFYAHVCRFLSETTLPLIALWLPQLQILLDREHYAPTHLPSSRLNSFISPSSKRKTPFLIDRTFGLSPGFHWQTVESQENVCNGIDSNLELHTEVSVALGCKAFFLDPLLTHYTLQRVLNCGLDVCGLRLLYSARKLQSDSVGAEPVLQSIDEICHPLLALAVRGPHARSAFRDLTSSLNPLRSTSLNSLCRGGSQEAPLLSSTQLASEVHRELCFWFSGRLAGKKAQKHNGHLKGVIPAHNRDKGSMSNSSPSPSFLCATTKADLLLVVSPAVPPCCYGQVLAVCERRGFGLMGLQRLQPQSHWADVLGLNDQQALVFCAPHSVILHQKEQELPSYCLLLILRKENAVHHSISLPAALMREVKVPQLRLGGVDTVGADLCYHTVPYSRELSCIFVKPMWASPDPSRVILSCHKCSSTSDTEQVVILSLCGKDMSKGLSLLHRVLATGPKGFELLGLNFLPALTRHQAKELTPYEVGEPLCQDSVDILTSSPVLVCALSRAEAFSSLKKHLPHGYPGNLGVLMSATPEVASRQASVFFFEHEMTPDQSKQSQSISLQSCSTKDPQRQLTVCLFKPGSWCRALAETVHKLQQSGLRVVGLRVFTLGESTAACIVPAQNDVTDMEAQVEYLCSGSSLALCLEGEDAVKRLLDVILHLDSSHWMTSSAVAHSYNPIYGSGSCEEAIQDVKKLFPEGLCCTESSTTTRQKIFSLCSDSVASVERERRCTLAPVSSVHLPLSLESRPNKGSLVHRAHWQTTCLLVPFDAPPLSHKPSQQLELLWQLLRSGCYLVAGRMSVLDSEQRKHITQTLQVSSRGNERMAQVKKAPCLILALQGEDVVTRLNLRLENSINKESAYLDEVARMIIYPENEKEAEQLICYLFDTLSPESSQHIVPKGSAPTNSSPLVLLGRHLVRVRAALRASHVAFEDKEYPHTSDEKLF